MKFFEDPELNTLIKNQIADLFIKRTQVTSSFGCREIYPSMTLEDLQTTSEYFNTPGKIELYYNNIVNNLCEFVTAPEYAEFGSVNAGFQRSLDANFMVRYWQYAKRISKSRPIRILDFGGCVGTLAYTSKLLAEEQLAEWIVIDLPNVVSVGTNLKENILRQLDPASPIKDCLRKLTFLSASEETILPKPTLSSDLHIVCNGVWMHLPNPISVLNEFFQQRPASIALSNVFEFNDQFRNFMRSQVSFSRDYVVVGSPARSGDEHSFSVWAAGSVGDLIASAAQQRGIGMGQITREIRDAFNLKIDKLVSEHTAQWIAHLEESVNYVVPLYYN